MTDPTLMVIIGGTLFCMWLVAMTKDTLTFRWYLWRGYVWYTPKPKIINDTKMVVFPRVRTHKLVLQEIARLEALLKEKDRHAENIVTKKHVLNSRQISFLPTVSNSTNGHKITLSWPIYNPDTGNLDTYLLVFKDQHARARFTSENDLWVEREIRNVGKDRRTIYRRMWVDCARWNSLNEQEQREYIPQSDNEYDPEIDIDILKYFPYKDKKKRHFIEDEFLPFRWSIEHSAAPFSIANHKDMSEINIGKKRIK